MVLTPFLFYFLLWLTGESLDGARAFGWLGPANAPASWESALSLYRVWPVGRLSEVREGMECVCGSVIHCTHAYTSLIANKRTFKSKTDRVVGPPLPNPHLGRDGLRRLLLLLPGYRGHRGK